jgi:sporulation-control protein
MKRVLSSLGIGAAKVDLILPRTDLTQGESVQAEVHVKGGSTEQDVDEIYFALLTRYKEEDGYGVGVVDRFKLTDPFTIGPDEERTFDVTIDVPLSTPVTVGRTDVWIETGLDIKMALDPSDRDTVQIKPHERTDALFRALESLGFHLKSAECKSVHKGLFGASRQFVQEFEFVPRGGPFSGKLDELEVVARPSESQLDVYLEVDRRGGFLSEMTDTDERFVNLSFAETDPSALADRLRSEIEKHA